MIHDNFNGFYQGKRVFLTGHTGFKGSWMASWLKQLGAVVKGYSLPPHTNPSHVELMDLDIESEYGDIMDDESLETSIRDFKPDLVVHMAAKTIVRESYENPIDTFKVNVIGTLNLFKACLKLPDIQAILNVTTDKCYRNDEIIWGYREHDPLGGDDPYSASKACSEIASHSWQNSFLRNSDCHLMTARAGNVIGGGDWARDRLIPDIIRSASNNQEVIIRSPNSTRPWQHVLEPLSGYLLLLEKACTGNSSLSGAWNFGPDETKEFTVFEVLTMMQEQWENIQYRIDEPDEKRPESQRLRLDSTKSRTYLKWRPVWDTHEAVSRTANWYRSYYHDGEIRTQDDLVAFTNQLNQV